MHVGLDRLVSEGELRKKVAGRAVGLLAHPASVTRELEHAESVLRRVGAQIAALFGPEHGYGGEAQDMATVGHEAGAGPRIVSLYGDTEADLSPRDEDLEGLDVLLLDLQDVGARYYTFVWTALLALRACVRRGLEVVLLDRPNPLGADATSLEGPLPDARYLSFVGLEPVPVRHALTLGEVVAAFALRDGVPTSALTIVRSHGIDRAVHASGWDRAFVPPSPNMPTYDTALVYPGGCLLEGTNLSEGRGTTRPFEMVGAPWLDGEKLAASLRETKLPGFRARPTAFLPTFQKHARQRCSGVHVHVTNAALFRPYATYLALLAAARAQNPERFAFRTERYEYRDDVPALDLLTGSALAREAIALGATPRDVASLADVGAPEYVVHGEAQRALDAYAV